MKHTIFFLLLLIANVMSQTEQSHTDWDIEPSFKYDALCFLNILTADTFYLTYHQAEYDKFKDKITEPAKQSLAHLSKTIKDNGNIVSAYLSLYFSAVEDSTLEQMTARLDNLAELKDNFSKTPYHDEESWKVFESTAPDLKVIFAFLKDIKFEEYWKENILPIVNKKIDEIKPGLPDYDVIKYNEYYLGYKLPTNKIVVYMLYYVKPHGIRITGMRFLTDQSWPFNIVIRNASHEMMHPPYDYANDKELQEAIQTFTKDEFFMDKLNNHNPSFGYTTLEGLVEEDCVQAIDQLINEKLGVSKDAALRWKESDDGIHVLAISLYQLMKAENYNSKNEIFRDFFIRMIKAGKLSPDEIKRYHKNFYN
jgi:hypothetical protein